MRASPPRVPPDGRGVVVTGASSGLGRATALHLERLGFRVFAGVRREEDGEKLVAQAASGRLHPVMLDVTEPDQVRRAAGEVARRLGPAPLWGLVNNAGITVPGPLECLSPQRLRWQLEVNVIGPVALVQAFLPVLRRGPGRIVNVTSGLGRVALPYLGAYVAAQFAKEGLSDTLRRELRPFGVTVSVVRPGAIPTPIWDKIAQDGADALSAAAEDTAALYRAPFRRFLAANERTARRSRTRPEDVAGVVARVLTARRPRTRYAVGPDVRLAGAAARLLPDALLDRHLASFTKEKTDEQ